MTTVDDESDRNLAVLDVQPGEQILIVGCDNDRLDRRIESVVKPGGRVVRVAGFALPFADGGFDAALCIGHLATCEHPRQALSEIRRVLRPGGRLVVACADEDTRIYNARDRDRGRRIERAMANCSIDPWIGRRLAQALTLAGFRLARELVTCEVEHHFQPGHAGYSRAQTLHQDLVTKGRIAADDYGGWLDDLRAAEWDGSYCYAVATIAYLAERE